MAVPPPTEELAREAVVRCEALLVRAAELSTGRERRRLKRLGALVADPLGRDLLHVLTDQVLRIRSPRHAVRRLAAVVADGLPSGLGWLDRLGLRLAVRAGPLAPRLVKRAVDVRIRAETRGVVLPAEDRALTRYLARRRRDGMRLNVNLLGEAILGDDEAAARLKAVQALLRRPDVDYVSVKITALCANLDVLAFDHSVDRICERLRAIYRTAQRRSPAAFVNLDMEEYRDLALTVAALQRVLDEAEFRDLEAGIVLQAYIPDSHAALADLCRWANARRAAGGAGIKVRIVKGANLAMESVEAELHGWPQAPYDDKADVDASFKRMMLTALECGEPGAVRLGVASHNLFDVGWALALRAADGFADRVELEMLEGMAPAQARAVREAAGSLLLYAPIVRAVERDASIAYLSRRLDENSAPQNFLRSLFTMTPGCAAHRAERERFERAVARVSSVPTAPRRVQDRIADVTTPPSPPAYTRFANEPDTDFTRPVNRDWVVKHLAAGPVARPLPEMSTIDAVDRALERARDAASVWRDSSTQERRDALLRIAEVVVRHRGEAIAVMAHETRKTVREADPEVSEAIDFARDLADRLSLVDALREGGATVAPRGVVLVVAPWNFPFAIPMGGVATALAAGNAVLLKPAPEAMSTAAELVARVHEAGVPPELVQLAPVPEDEVGRHLITHDGVDQVVLTGAYATAAMFLDWKPTLRLVAETSGKNAVVVTAAADLDLAIADIVRSAFGHAGQKCSAASLAIVEASVYDDGAFLGRLADAVRSVRVGPATGLPSMVSEIIRPPDGVLLRGLTSLDEGESWLVEPRFLGGSPNAADDGRLWSPGVRRDVQPGSWFHRTECFGPVLGVMRAANLSEAIDLHNATPFGLTGGLHSLDPAEIDEWLDRVEIGNAYVNRHITGAIVRRQPFGGWKRSAVGSGAKPGGPNALLAVSRISSVDRVDRATAERSYADAWTEVFSRELDETGLAAERNVLRYCGLRAVIARIGSDTTADDVALLHSAARRTGTALDISGGGVRTDVGSSVTVEDDAALAARIAAAPPDRLRVLGAASEDLRRACHAANVAIDDSPVTGLGRVDVFRFLREQAVSITMHRHGRIAEASEGHPRRAW